MAHSLFRPPLRGIIALTLLMSASVAQAAGAPGREPRPDPLDPQARVPDVNYQSPLANYRRLGEDKVVPWSEANETVNRIGGWRAYAREAQQPEVTAPASGTSSTPVPAPGAAHKTH